MLFYRTVYGGIICTDDVRMDYKFHTGKFVSEDSAEYLGHLYGQLGTLITEVIVPPEEWRGKSRVDVIKMFRDEHPDWSLSKCRDHMEECISEFTSGCPSPHKGVGPS